MVTLFSDRKEEDKTDKPPATTTALVPQPEQKLTPYMENFIKAWEKAQNTTQSAGATLRVSEVLGSLARLYERIRNVVEYKGEHVLKRNAIERILKRLLWERSSHDTQRIAE